jgi:drug/metabolite transporter (DMT)-like permease
MLQQDNQSGGRLPLSAGLILVLLCFLWGGQSVSIKFSNQGIPPLLAAALRSLVAGVLVWAYARMRGRVVTFPQGQTGHALMIGILFGLEFLFLYWSLVFTLVSRSLIFLYTHPFWVALGAKKDSGLKESRAQI